jgi:nucleoside-diphosphate-sugar epimerase
LSRVLVTGGTGLIGAPAVDVLLEAGHEVHSVTTRDPASLRADVSWHRGDLLHPATASQVIGAARPTHLLHLAWCTEHGAYWTSPENLPWVEASLRLWRAFAEAGGERAVIAGSCAEYEWGEPVLSESSTPLRPATVYGASKDALRRVLEAASADGPSLAWGRVFFVYGPGEQATRLIPSVARALIEGRPAPCTSGEQVRDFLHVDDVASAFRALVESELRGPVNVGSGDGITVRAVVEAIGRLTGRPELIELGAVTPPEGDPPSLVADPARIRDELGWRPSVGLEEGLAGAIEVLRRSPAADSA